MAYGDASVGVAYETQTAEGTPATSFTNFERIITATGIAGIVQKDELSSVNLSMFAEKPKDGKWTTEFTLNFHLTANAYARIIAACMGAVTTWDTGVSTIQITAFANLGTDAVTVNLDGTSVTVTEDGVGVPPAWNAAGTDDATATSLAAALDTIAGISAAAVTDTVTITPDDFEDPYTITLSDPAGWTYTASGAYHHVLTPDRDAANRRFYTFQFDRSGRIKTLMDCTPLTMSFTATDKFIDCSIEMGARYISHCQFIPTPTTVASYDGVVFTAGQYNAATDTSAETFEVRVNTAGTLGAAAGSEPILETRVGGAGGWSSGRRVYPNTPFEIMTAAEAPTGIHVVYLLGSNNVFDFAAGPDLWTISSRGTASSGSIDATPPFTWNSKEISRYIDNGTAFENGKCPEDMTYAMDRGMIRDDFQACSNVVGSHDPSAHATIGGTFTVRVEDARYHQQSFNRGDDVATRSLEMVAEGPTIGTTGIYDRFGIANAQISLDDMSDDIDGVFIVKPTITWVAHPSTVLLNDAMTITYRNDQPLLTSG